MTCFNSIRTTIGRHRGFPVDLGEWLFWDVPGQLCTDGLAIKMPSWIGLDWIGLSTEQLVVQFQPLPAQGMRCSEGIAVSKCFM